MNTGETPQDPGNGSDCGCNADPTGAAENTVTGLPLLRTWRAVYGFVLVLFAIYVVLLVALERVFS